MRLPEGECAACDPRVVIPVTPWLATRACPRGTAIIVGGTTVAHASAVEADSHGRELISRAVVAMLPADAADVAA